MDTTRIGSQEFTPSEWQSVTNLAKRKEGFHAKLTPQNVIRLALGLPLRQRGGARPNTGNRKARAQAFCILAQRAENARENLL